MSASVHFSSKTDLWATPSEFFAMVDAELRLTLDVCALPENAKCERFFSPGDNGLKQEWTRACWMNPPYGREIGLWVKKAYESAKAGATVVCLLPACTDTYLWHDFVTKADKIRFIQGRLRFGSAKASAPFPSALVVFRPPPATRIRVRRVRQLPGFGSPAA